MKNRLKEQSYVALTFSEVLIPMSIENFYGWKLEIHIKM